MKKVGLISIYTGFNYGTTLQAYAMNKFISLLGYEPYMMWYKSSLVAGRDVRINKILKILSRTWFRPLLFKKTFFTYSNNIGRKMSEETRKAFVSFVENKMNIHMMSNKEMSLLSSGDELIAVVTGSAQVWNADAVYVSPLYYLRFVPQKRRIAYAPSMGKDIVPKYNKKILARYIGEIPYVSIRETKGAELIKQLTGKTPPVVLDPTLIFNGEQWREMLVTAYNSKYILLYFLDEPLDYVLDQICKIKKELDVDIYAVPYRFNKISKKIEGARFLSGGPAEFVSLVDNAVFLCTDSFHGVAFAINFHTPFRIFQRNYGHATNQSSRIISLLSILKLMTKYQQIEEDELPADWNSFDFEKVEHLLNEERAKSISFLKNALEETQREKYYE